ncbi:MAG: transposase [Ilumatobacteraceae bacterium]
MRDPPPPAAHLGQFERAWLGTPPRRPRRRRPRRAVWPARELLSEVYTGRDLAHAKRRLIVFLQHAADAEVPELTRLAHTVDRWRDGILAFHTTGGASNGPTEAVNLLIEKIRRLGHGYRNFTN